MFTRHQYMTHECTHEQYYSQFVTPGIKAAIRNYFGTDNLVASTNPHFNDIPLTKWDMFIGYKALENKLSPNHIFASIIAKLKEANGSGGYSPSDFTCISKQAAREIVAEERAKTATVSAE